MKARLFQDITAWLSKLLLLFLIARQCLLGEASGCKDMIWLPEKSGSYLRNHGIQNMTVSSQTMCKIMCYLSEKTCLSFNFHQSTSTCEINDSDEFQHPDDLITMDGYRYIGTKNGCQSNPCPANATCQADLTQDGAFSCLCPSGFTGTHCEKDIDECTSAYDSCPANTKCLNTVGSYECPCKPGYTKSGQQCLRKTGTMEFPGKSCLSILTSGDSQGTGEYWLDPMNTGNPIKAFCDMETDGGGWTVLKRMYLRTPNLPVSKEANTLDAAIAGGLSTDQNIFPKGQAMLELHQVMGFDQIHFYCHKKSVGRVVSIMTKNNTAGHQVVWYFTDDAYASTTFPDACGSFDRLAEENSILAQNCSLWGKEDGQTAVGKWGWNKFLWAWRITSSPFAIRQNKDEYGFSSSNQFSCCDDSWTDPGQLSVNDTWQIAVR